MTPVIEASTLTKRYGSARGVEIVDRLQRGGAVEAGVGEDDEEPRGVRDAARPAPRALADRQPHVQDTEDDAGDLGRGVGVQGAPRTARRE